VGQHHRLLGDDLLVAAVVVARAAAARLHGVSVGVGGRRVVHIFHFVPARLDQAEQQLPKDTPQLLAAAQRGRRTRHRTPQDP